jgi:hypothetical protein
MNILVMRLAFKAFTELQSKLTQRPFRTIDHFNDMIEYEPKRKERKKRFKQTKANSVENHRQRYLRQDLSNREGLPPRKSRKSCDP